MDLRHRMLPRRQTMIARGRERRNERRPAGEVVGRVVGPERRIAGCPEDRGDRGVLRGGFRHQHPVGGGIERCRSGRAVERRSLPAAERQGRKRKEKRPHRALRCPGPDATFRPQTAPCPARACEHG